MTDLLAREFDNCCEENKGFYAGDIYIWDSEARYYDRQELTKGNQKRQGGCSHNTMFLMSYNTLNHDIKQC